MKQLNFNVIFKAQIYINLKNELLFHSLFKSFILKKILFYIILHYLIKLVKLVTVKCSKMYEA